MLIDTANPVLENGHDFVYGTTLIKWYTTSILSGSAEGYLPWCLYL